MSELKERPDPETPTRVTWECPNCRTTHSLVEPRHVALETAWDLLGGGIPCVVIEDNAAAVMREQDLAERAAAIFSRAPFFAIDIDAAAPVTRKWWDLRRYRKD